MLGIPKNNNKIIDLTNMYDRFNTCLDFFNENA